MAFQQYASADEPLQLAGATVLVVSRPTAVAAADGDQSDGEWLRLRGGLASVRTRLAGCPHTPLAACGTAGGLEVSQRRAAGGTWGDLERGRGSLRYEVAAQGTLPDGDGGSGGAYVVLELPDFQAQLPTFGTHFPIRFVPLLFAAGSDVNGAGAGAGGLQPQAAGALALDLSGGDAWQLEYSEVAAAAPTGNAPAAAVARQRGAAACEAAAAALLLLL